MSVIEIFLTESLALSSQEMYEKNDIFERVRAKPTLEKSPRKKIDYCPLKNHADGQFQGCSEIFFEGGVLYFFIWVTKLRDYFGIFHSKTPFNLKVISIKDGVSAPKSGQIYLKFLHQKLRYILNF